MFKRIAVFGVLLPIFAVLGISTPANAGAAGSAFTVQCTVTLNPWPSPSGSATCTGTAGGVIVIVDTSKTPPVEVINCGVNACNFSATVGYDEPCPPPLDTLDVPPPIGFADGSFTVTDGTDTLDGQLSWTRVGATAAVTLVPTDYKEGAVTHSASGAGAAVAAFAPTSAIGTTPVIGTCAHPTATTALVVAVGAIAATIS